MKNEILNFLCCPNCRSDFKLEILDQYAGEIESGYLVCGNCDVKYPIVNRIPRILFTKPLNTEQKTADSFEFAWKYYGPLLSSNLNSEFLTLVHPWKESDFVDKIVLDVGCGAGRLSRLASGYGARHVFSVDLGRAVEAAHKLSARYSNIHFFQASLFELPFRQKFDIIFSLGVLHHTPCPYLGFRNILKLLKDRGKIGIWVYGKEGNRIIGPLMNIFRIVTTRLNNKTRVASSKLIVKIEETFYRLISRFSENIFYGDYLKYFNTQLSAADREYVVFDFMSTHLIRYISKKQLENWIAENSLADAVITRRNTNSWGLTAKKG